MTAPATSSTTARAPLLPTPSFQAHSVQPAPSPPSAEPTMQKVMVMLRQLQHQIHDSSSGRASSAYSLPPSSTSGTLCSSWLLDSGALLHMTPDASLLASCCPPTHTTRVRIADGTSLPVHWSPVHFLILCTRGLSCSSPFYEPYVCEPAH